MTTDPKAALNTIATHLRALHKLLLDHEKGVYEKTFGRIENPYQLLHLAMEDPQFAWLRAMSGEMVHLDEVRLNRNGVTETDLRLVGTRLRALLITDRAETSFQQHFGEAREVDPGIVLALRELMNALPEAPKVQLFLSAGEEQDNKDPLPGAIRPGTLVPGFGDKGYYALGAIEERGLLKDVPLKSVRRSNETVLGIASVQMDWTANDETVSADPWTPVVIQTGTGTTIGSKPADDGVLVSLYVRQREIGGESALLPQASAEVDDWLKLADDDVLRNNVAAWARIASPGTSMPIPDTQDNDALVYVVAGTIEIDGVQIPDSRLALIRHPENVEINTVTDSMFLTILVDPTAKVTRAGSVAR